MEIAAFLPCVVLALAFWQAPEPNGGGLQPGTLPHSWRTGGPTCGDAPEWEVHEYNPDFVILRENGCVNYEKPFLFLFFGRDRCLLIDTGAGKTHLEQQVSEIIDNWAVTHHRKAPPLLVGHTHSHGDHISGDAQLRERANTTVLPLTLDATQKLFGIASWPEDMGHIDLGDRVLDVVPIPGHDFLSVAYYDRQTGVLLTGDSLYPGRLYVRDFPAFVKSTERLVRFTEGKIVTHLLGNHIEQTRTPYLDYKVGTKYQPDEHALELGRGELLELNEALAQMKSPVRMAFRDFTIWPAAIPPPSSGPKK